jgi:phage terminase small subunit
LDNVGVERAIRAAIAQRTQRTAAAQDDVVLALARLLKSDLRRVASWDAHGNVVIVPSGLVSDEDGAAIQELSQTVLPNGVIRLKVKLHDKLGAARLLAQHLGMLVERHEHSGRGGRSLREEIFEASWGDDPVPPTEEGGEAT